jgi:hypothetical protein
MNLELARHKATLSNPDSTPERKAAALAALTEIAGHRSDPKSDEAKLVLRELGIGAPAIAENTENVQVQIAADSAHDEHVSPNDPDWYWKLWAKQISEDRALYERAKADGLSAAETVAKMREEQGKHAAMKYGVIFEHAALCKRDGAYAARTYFCPVISRMLKEIEQWSPHDWPAIEVARATLAEYQYQPSPSSQPSTK